ncbi:MAG: phosphoribosylformylglycinamidine synthase subunit PurQ [Candidatus Magnetobacterium sp. LHC-1]|uniref:Phosphoribosylformylglycinamidine synthase subunit PurQ n=1 Tax=Candidatus Magnetobacterium casense TaxID=1455061 RepID=A0ABS6RZ02_9BACT|nr:phosphoribosylformylglycinamidine synthase subunit PurQ [Candidatus Magnetobacterium casensis]MBF0607520.1 phosphoribosylformylglycinamidine synthase subunit PurQ [Nitrospirota bacterium]MBV6341013.1 phosphoribosylformylglycinamidine synthase subunit PurQ [Candidatus Magnetobacterium casensis]
MFGIVVFPGSNCDHDCYYVVKHVLGRQATFIWHKDSRFDADIRAIILPGGFSYGDYLRAGALAQFSPIIKAVTEFAQRGGIVIGICNGFQILLECGLLPGAMLPNKDLRFICKYVHVCVDNVGTPFTNTYSPGQVLKIPIAHAMGNYFAEASVIERLTANNQIVFRYCDQDGAVSDNVNPNGALLNIAGITNETGNVLGMMPHPERCVQDILGSSDGRALFEAMASSMLQQYT